MIRSAVVVEAKLEVVLVIVHNLARLYDSALERRRGVIAVVVDAVIIKILDDERIEGVVVVQEESSPVVEQHVEE